MVKNATLVGVLLTFCLSLFVVAAQPDGFALLDIHADYFHRTGICANFQQFPIHSLPKSADEAESYNLGWWKNKPGEYNVCTKNNVRLTGDIVPLQYVGRTPTDTGVCHFKPNETFYVQQQMDQLANLNASAALFLLDKGTPSTFHIKNYLFSRFFNPKVTNDTPTFYMYKHIFEDLYAQFNETSAAFRFYRPSDPFLDAAVFVILALATGCIIIGCLWYSYDLRRRIDLGELKLDSNGQLTDATDETILPVRGDSPTSNDRPQSAESEKIWWCITTGCCVHVCYAVQAFAVVTTILLLGFFYRPVAVEFFNVFVVIGGTLCMQKCAMALIRLCIHDPKWRPLSSLCFFGDEEELTNRWWVPSPFYKPFRPIGFAVFVLAGAFAITWRLNMDHPQAYLMLNLMNICICVHSVKASELRSLQLISFFLIAMFIYDIVMVFGTRLITENGCSVMVQVVTGMDCAKTRKIDYSSDWPIAPVVAGLQGRPQRIPILFYVPLLSNPVGHCFDALIEGENQHMMLGLGDVIAPGYLIAFAFYLDVRKGNKFHLYGFTAVIGYTIGMLTTFLSLKLMATAQPALIYLVPFTLLPLILVCLYKGTLREAWSGNIKPVNC